MTPAIMTADETKAWLRSLGLKPTPRLPKGDRVLYVVPPTGPTGSLWKVAPALGGGFEVGVYEPPVKHAFSDTSFRLNINLDTLGDLALPRVAKLLREIADALDATDEKDNLPGGGWVRHYQTIYDTDGNDVGRFAIKSISER